MAQDKKSSSNLNVVIVGEPIISDFQRKRLAEGRLWADGYSQSELDAAQEKYGLAFPPDLIALFLERRPVLGYDWRSDDEKFAKCLGGLSKDYYSTSRITPCGGRSGVSDRKPQAPGPR